MKADKIKVGKTYLTRKPRTKYEKHYHGAEVSEHYVLKIEGDKVWYDDLENKLWAQVNHKFPRLLSSFAEEHVRQLTAQEEIMRFAVLFYKSAINNQRAKAPETVEYGGHVWKKDSDTFFYTEPPFKIIPNGISWDNHDHEYFYAEGESLERLKELYEEEMICRALGLFLENRRKLQHENN